MWGVGSGEDSARSAVIPAARCGYATTFARLNELARFFLLGILQTCNTTRQQLAGLKKAAFATHPPAPVLSSFAVYFLRVGSGMIPKHLALASYPRPEKPTPAWLGGWVGHGVGGFAINFIHSHQNPPLMFYVVVFYLFAKRNNQAQSRAIGFCSAHVLATGRGATPPVCARQAPPISRPNKKQRTARGCVRARVGGSRRATRQLMARCAADMHTDIDVVCKSDPHASLGAPAHIFLTPARAASFMGGDTGSAPR
jgi:hypothetical protein